LILFGNCWNRTREPFYKRGISEGFRDFFCAFFIENSIPVSAPELSSKKYQENAKPAFLIGEAGFLLSAQSPRVVVAAPRDIGERNCLRIGVFRNCCAKRKFDRIGKTVLLKLSDVTKGFLVSFARRSMLKAPLAVLRAHVAACGLGQLVPPCTVLFQLMRHAPCWQIRFACCREVRFT